MSNKAKGAKRRTSKKRELDVGVAVTQAVAMRLVADDLLKSLGRMESGEGQFHKLFGYSVSAVLLRAFATELMLKTLSFMKTGKYRTDRKGHDLLVLFNDLDSETKQLIRDLEEKHGIAPLAQILEKHRDDFVDWRYIGQLDGMHVDFWDLDKALGILMAVFETLQSPGGGPFEHPKPLRPGDPMED